VPPANRSAGVAHLYVVYNADRSELGVCTPPEWSVSSIAERYHDQRLSAADCHARDATQFGPL